MQIAGLQTMYPAGNSRSKFEKRPPEQAHGRIGGRYGYACFNRKVSLRSLDLFPPPQQSAEKITQRLHKSTSGIFHSGIRSGITAIPGAFYLHLAAAVETVAENQQREEKEDGNNGKHTDPVQQRTKRKYHMIHISRR